MALGEYEDAIDTTLTPPRAQYGATHSNLEKRNSLRYGVFASLGKPQQRLMHHSSEQESGSSPLVYHGGLRRGAADRDLWCGPDSAR
jgi:hypothetical protein